MKGIAIYESPFMGEMYVRAVDIRHANYTFESATAEDASVSLSGYFSKSSQAKCSKKDTYDFETGALISLMRMCGRDKVTKACNELYRDDNYKNALQEMTENCEKLMRENEDLKKDFDKVRDLKDFYKKNYNERLEEIKSLKEDKDKSWKNYQRNIQKKQDRINELEAQVIASEDDKLKNIEYYEKEIKNLNYRLTCKDISLEAKDKKISIYEKSISALKAENEKLKLDCEKLRHGYSAGLGRLVNINGVNYRECDEKGRVVWMTSQPERFSFFADYIDTDTLDTLRSWHKKPDVSKREKMWDDILAPGRTSIYVKVEDVADFLDEATKVGVTWITGVAPNKQRPYFNREGAYFFVESSNGKHSMTWGCVANPAEAESAIHYIRPMRWDLFEKGRIYVKVKPEYFEEFQTTCRNHLERGKAPNTYYFNDESIVVNLPEEGRFCVTKDLKGFKKRPVVDWEDVR